MPATKVVMETSLGTIEIELDGDKAPLSVANFLSYVDDGFYNGTIFHRVIKDFMIQGGGFLPNMTQKKTKGTIKNEGGNGLKNVKGAIAMARTIGTGQRDGPVLHQHGRQRLPRPCPGVRRRRLCCLRQGDQRERGRRQDPGGGDDEEGGHDRCAEPGCGDNVGEAGLR